MENLRILLDNNIIDKINDILNYLIEKSLHVEVFICSTILEELASIPDTKKEIRIINLLQLAKLEAKFVNDSVIVWDNSRWDFSDWSNGIIYNNNVNDSHNNVHDAIIAETSVKHNCYLITDDKRLYNKMRKHNYKVLSLSELKEILIQL